MHPKALSEPSLAMGVVTRMQQKKRDDKLVADVAAGKEDVVKVTTLVDTVCQKKQTRKNKFKSVETGSHEVVAPVLASKRGRGSTTIVLIIPVAPVSVPARMEQGLSQ